MKLYNSVGPNPHVVRMFAAEKGLTLPMVEIDLMGGENRKPPYQDTVNPAGQTPALVLSDGQIITEITVICEYLEEKHPSPVLIGATPEQRAETRMWTRRIDLNICEPLTNAFRGVRGARPVREPHQAGRRRGRGRAEGDRQGPHPVAGRPDGRQRSSSAATGSAWPTSCCSCSSASVVRSASRSRTRRPG